MSELDSIVGAGRACRGSDVDFYSDDPAEVDVALALCEDCPVKWACLAVALERGEEFGVWGATTAGQRQAITSVLRGCQGATGTLAVPDSTVAALTPRDRRRHLEAVPA